MLALLMLSGRWKSLPTHSTQDSAPANCHQNQEPVSPFLKAILLLPDFNSTSPHTFTGSDSTSDPFPRWPPTVAVSLCGPGSHSVSLNTIPPLQAGQQTLREQGSCLSLTILSQIRGARPQNEGLIDSTNLSCLFHSDVQTIRWNCMCPIVRVPPPLPEVITAQTAVPSN